jgi:hypothetical protein
MQTTIVMQDNKIEMFNSSRTTEVFAGADGIKKFLKRVQKGGNYILDSLVKQIVGYDSRVPANLEEYYQPRKRRMYNEVE